MELVWLVVFAGLLAWIHRWLTAGQTEFKKRGLYFEKPWPLVGNNLDIVLEKCCFHKVLAEFYARTRKHKVVGFFNFLTPTIMVNDPEAIKQITVKDFEYFPNHQNFFAPNERLAADMVSTMKDQRWKHMRTNLTPIFTAAKMRTMFSLMSECFAECLDHLEIQSKSGSKSGEGFDLEMKEVSNRLSNDLIATTAFGLKINSFTAPKNEFFQIGKSLIFLKGLPLYKMMFANAFPKITTLLGIKIFEQRKTEYFIRLVVDAMKYREKHNIVRPDMIQLLMETRKESDNKWTEDEIVAQCFIFFFAAFENNANLICTTTYELLENPDIQERLYEEIMETQESLNGAPLNYDAVMKMKYMDMIISESLRKWTLTPVTDRICAKDYTLRDEDGSKVFDFKAGDRVLIPIGGMQMDDIYFPDPSKFDPERFSDENKGKLVPYTYIPFGVGPRICIGNRYALMQAKAMLYNLIIKYKIERAPKTVKDLLTESKGFQLIPNAGYWMRLVPRK